MTTEYSVSVDDWNDSKWDHTGVSIMRDYYENNRVARKEAKDLDISIESYADEKAAESYPMMLYAYPLFSEPSDEQIRKVCLKTCCTVVLDNETDTYYLALCGGGMDLSQSVALAYLMTDGFIPRSLVHEVCRQPCMSVGKSDYRKIVKEIKKQLKNEIRNCQSDLKSWNSEMKEFNRREKEKREVKKDNA